MNRIAIDIGGTFTDITYIDEETMEIIVDKAESTPGSLADGVVNAIKKIKRDIQEVDVVVHGTTVGMNTLIQRNGAKVGLITTKGYRDILEIARGDRPEMYNLLWKKPKTLVPRFLRLGVTERLNYAGEVITELDEKDVEIAVNVFKKHGVEAIAVCLLHSYANPVHEERIAEIINRIWPEILVSLSSRVAREYREFERTSTTVLDAYIKNNIEDYLDQLSSILDKMGLKGLLLITSASGVLSIPIAKEKAITTVVSGPTSGAIGTARLGALIGEKNILTMDVGGTSFDISLIRNGRNVEREEGYLVGFPMIVPSIDIRTIGAGGGSIARVDVGGMLQVGPESAGADPGPICYGKGGKHPTVTDAAVVNGLIDPQYFLGGEIPLDEDAAKKSIETIAENLGISLNQAAEGIITICKNNMTNAVREILVGEGYDPRDFIIVAYGGGGGIFAESVATDMNILKIVIPFSPGVFSAWGMLSTDFVHNFAQTHIAYTDELDFAGVTEIYNRMENEARDLLKHEEIPESDISIVRTVDMRYDGQGHYVEVSIPDGTLHDDVKQIMNENFRRLHKAKYGHDLDALTETVNLRLKAIGKIKDVKIEKLKKGKLPPGAVKEKRKVFLEGDFIDCPIYLRSLLLQGNHIDGPAIVEEPTHTTVITKDQSMDVDGFGNLLIKVGGTL